MWRNVVGGLLAVAVVLSSCPGVFAQTTDITQGTWLWTRTDYGDGSTVDAADPSLYTLTFLDNGVVTFQADCNTGSGQYMLAGSSLKLQGGPMTLVACGPGSQDSVFLHDLGQVVSYAFDGEQLVLNLRLDTGNMVFSPTPPPSLTSIEWQATGINNGHGGVASVLPDTSVTAIFFDNGSVVGQTGCNTYNAPYSLAGSTIEIGPIATTRRACGTEEASAQEQAFVAALSASSAYELGVNRLTLRNANGATQ